MSRLLAIVVPTACGKTHVLKKLNHPNVQEADDICMPRATATLDELRTFAKNYNDWSPYDVELSYEIHRRIKPETKIIMLASAELTIALSARVVAVVVLDRHLWEVNVASRGKRVADYEPCYKAAEAIATHNCSSYETFEETIKMIVEQHCNQPLAQSGTKPYLEVGASNGIDT